MTVESVSPIGNAQEWDDRDPKLGRKKRLLLMFLFCLLMLWGADRMQFGPASTISIDLPLNQELRDFVENLQERGAIFRNATDQDEPSSNNPPGSVVPAGGGSRNDGGGTTGGSSGGETGSGDSRTTGGGSTGGDSGTSGGTTGGSSGGDTGSSTGGGSTGGDSESTGGGGPRGGGGGGNGGDSGGGEEEDDLNPPSSNLVVTVRLVSSAGNTIYPRYHFENGNATLVLDERRFRPGFYTLIITSTDSVSGDSSSASQSLAWGVLAMNTDKDRYRVGETSEIHFGVLDELGAIVCDADLTLTITDPDNVDTILKTSNGTIEVTGTCGDKEAGLISPDYRTSHTMSKAGTYVLSLEAVTNTHTTTIDSDVQVVNGPAFLVKRTAATRLWPFAPSPMAIEVEFLSAFSGTIMDIVPSGFIVTSEAPDAELILDPETRDTQIVWRGSYEAGETASIAYIYDAPDIFPEFYLIGPLKMTDDNGTVFEEYRSWQIANDDASASTNYKFRRDVIASGGGEFALSSNYKLSDTIGEVGAGFVRSDNYELEGGYRHSDDSFISLACFTTLDLGTIPGFGQATGEANCTVIADDDAGYTLSWQVTTGSGGTQTGYMINQFENTIGPFTPAIDGTPETWSIATTDSEWGARLKSSSTDIDAQWGTDSVDEKWLNVGSGSSVEVVSRSTRTAVLGSTETFQFRAEVGTEKIQEKGTYDVLIDFIVSSPL